MGVPLNHPFWIGIFPYEPSILGYPPLLEPPSYLLEFSRCKGPLWLCEDLCLAWSLRCSAGEATPTKRAIKAQPALKEGKGYALKRVKLPLRDAEIEMISKSHSETAGEKREFLNRCWWCTVVFKGLKLHLWFWKSLGSQLCRLSLARTSEGLAPTKIYQ